MWIPLFGWFAMRRASMIPVDRGAGSQALADMTARAREVIRGGRQLIIFPEGTRRAAGAEPRYKFGVAHLYDVIGVPCVPVALNSGLFWPRRVPDPSARHDRGRIPRTDPAGPRQGGVLRPAAERHRDGNRAACRRRRGRAQAPLGFVRTLEPLRQQMQRGVAACRALRARSRSRSHSRGCCRTGRGPGARWWSCCSSVRRPAYCGWPRSTV